MLRSQVMTKPANRRARMRLRQDVLSWVHKWLRYGDDVATMPTARLRRAGRPPEQRVGVGVLCGGWGNLIAVEADDPQADQQEQHKEE